MIHQFQQYTKGADSPPAEQPTHAACSNTGAHEASVSPELGRPIVRYHGGKWRLAPWIIANLPPHRIYVEPFGGGASVLLRKPRSYAEVYNDLDGEIVNVFRVMRDRGSELKEAVRLTPFSRAEFLDSYLPHGDPLEQARRTIVRSFFGFGSAAASGEIVGFRSNSNRSGTTPAHDWANYADAIPSLVSRLRGVVIECRDGLAVMKHQDSNHTLHYVDPPYVHSTRSTKVRHTATGKSYRIEMTDADHSALADGLKQLAGMVVISGYPSELYQALYSDWRRLDRATHADGARERVECLWLNAAAVAALRPGWHQVSLDMGGAA